MRQEGFAVVALGMMSPHDGDNFVLILPSVNHFVDFGASATAVHVEPVGIDGREGSCGQAGEAEASNAAILGFEAIEDQAGGASGHDVVDMAGNAVGVYRHEFHFDVGVMCCENLTNECANLFGGGLHGDIIQVAIFKPERVQTGRTHELAGGAPFLLAHGTKVGVMVGVAASLAGGEGDQV